MMKGLHHIGVFTADIDKSIAFYDKIGFDTYYRVSLPNGTTIAFTRVGDLVIELICPPDAAQVAARTDGIVAHICIRVADIDGEVARLRGLGVQFETDAPGVMPALFANGAKNIFFRGPSNEHLELFEEM